jgi:hypothetical protein
MISAYNASINARLYVAALRRCYEFTISLDIYAMYLQSPENTAWQNKR